LSAWYQTDESLTAYLLVEAATPGFCALAVASQMATIHPAETNWSTT
jgi:hypothetical protein